MLSVIVTLVFPFRTHNCQVHIVKTMVIKPPMVVETLFKPLFIMKVETDRKQKWKK